MTENGEWTEAQGASEVQFDLKFETSNLDYPGIHVHLASNNPFGALWGHGVLQTASEVTSSSGFELSDLEYLCSHDSFAFKLYYLTNERGPNIIYWLRVFDPSKNRGWPLVFFHVFKISNKSSTRQNHCTFLRYSSIHVWKVHFSNIAPASYRRNIGKMRSLRTIITVSPAYTRQRETQ